jgi:uncharacterized membrane protein
MTKNQDILFPISLLIISVLILWVFKPTNTTSTNTVNTTYDTIAQKK